MTRRFTCRGFEGTYFQLAHMARAPGWWNATVVVAGVWFSASAPTPSAAKSRVRRKLDAVERAFRERGRR